MRSILVSWRIYGSKGNNGKVWLIARVGCITALQIPLLTSVSCSLANVFLAHAGFRGDGIESGRKYKI
jgi:hypothetical protein